MTAFRRAVACAAILLLTVLALPCADAAAAPHTPVPPALLATLQRLATATPVQGMLHITQHSSNGSGDKKHVSNAEAQLHIGAAAGISLQVPATELAAADAQLAAHQADPEKPAPLADLLQGLGIGQVQRMLDPAAQLVLLLRGAQLQSQQTTTLDGQPATLLHFTVPLRASKSAHELIKNYHDKLSLWLDAQGVPLAFVRQTSTEIGWMFLTLDNTDTQRGRFIVHDGRLLLTTLDVDSRGSGLGHHGDTRTQYVFTLQAQAPTAVR